jgi:hypothetical protein
MYLACSELALMIPAMEHRFGRVLARVLVIVAGAGLALWMAYYGALTAFSLIANWFPVWD